MIIIASCYSLRIRMTKFASFGLCVHLQALIVHLQPALPLQTNLSRLANSSTELHVTVPNSRRLDHYHPLFDIHVCTSKPITCFGIKWSCSTEHQHYLSFVCCSTALSRRLYLSYHRRGEAANASMFQDIVCFGGKRIGPAGSKLVAQTLLSEDPNICIWDCIYSYCLPGRFTLGLLASTSLRIVWWCRLLI